MTPEARAAFMAIGLCNLDLLETAWMGLANDFMLSEEELTELIVNNKSRIKQWVRARHSKDTRRTVNYWFRNNRSRVRDMGLPDLSDPLVRKRLGIDRKQITALASLPAMLIRQKIEAGSPESRPSDPEKVEIINALPTDAYYRQGSGRRRHVASPAYIEAKKARFAAIAEKARLREEEKAAERLKATSQSTKKPEIRIEVSKDVPRFSIWQRWFGWIGRLWRLIPGIKKMQDCPATE